MGKEAMSGEHWQLVTNEHVEFEKQPGWISRAQTTKPICLEEHVENISI